MNPPGESLGEIFDRAERAPPHQPDPDADRRALRRKAHRTGLLAVVAGIVIGLAGVFGDTYDSSLDNHMRTIGLWLFLLGYPLVRMYYWTRMP